MNRRWTRSAVAAGTALLLVAAGVGLAAKSTAATPGPPTNQSPPTVSGTPQEGATLTASTGSWNGTEPITYTYSWRRCDENGGSCSAISGATNRTYVLRRVDVGNTLRVRVTARNAGGTAAATSVPTAVVRLAPTPPPTTGCEGNAPLQVQGISLPERLNVDQGTLTPAIVGRSTRSVTIRVHVTCRGKSVQGALVYAAAVPFNQFTEAEQPSGSDGFAQLTLTQLRGFPAAGRQQLLVIFLRARKPGDSQLGGISTRRLVSFPVDLRR
jgi:hypothetical protein